MDKDWIEQLTDWRERQDQILDIYEAGVSVGKIAKELSISRARVHQIVKQAKTRRENAQKQALETDE